MSTTPNTIPTWANGRPNVGPQGTFATKLAYHRERAGMSQAELARWCCCEAGHISRMESGKRQPSRAMLVTLRTALGLSDDDAARLAVAAGYWPPSWPQHFVDELCGREER